MRKLFFIYLISLLTCLASHAQQSYWYNTDQLSSNKIQTICEDKFGYIWIGTEDGLNRYDGYRFDSFFHKDDDSLSLRSNYVKTLFIDEQGVLWIGTNRGVQYKKDGELSFHTVRLSNNKTPYVSQIIKLKNGQIWFSTSGRGIYYIDPKTPDVGFYMENLTNQLGTSIIRALMEDSKGTIWIGTPSNVAIYDPVSMKLSWFKDDIINKDVTGIFEDKNGDVFISTSNQAYRWKRKDNVLDSLISAENGSEITHSFMDSEYNYYITIRGNGLLKYNRDQNGMTPVIHNVGDKSLDRFDVSALYKDMHGNLWLGCFLNGMMVIINDDNLFKSIKFSDYDEDISGTVTAMMVDVNSNIWIGYNNKGLTCIDKQGRVIVNRQGQLYVNSLYQDKKGEIWAGLISGGLTKINQTNGELSVVVSNYWSSVYSITEDKTGKIYFSASGQGFMRYNPENEEVDGWSTQSSPDGVLHLTNDWVYSLYIDEDNLLWTGHDNGIDCYDIEKDEFVDVNDISTVLGNSGCFIIVEDSKHRLWFGTNKGLVMYDKQTKTSKSYSMSDGLSNDNICGIAEDNKGNIWVSTQVGLNKIDVNMGTIDRYYSGSGLIDRGYSKVFSVNKNRDLIYFGSNNGITFFNPEDITNNISVNDVQLTGFYLNDNIITSESQSGGKKIFEGPIQKADKFRLAYIDNSFTLEFSTLNFGDQDCISFEYTFDLAKDTWTSTPAGVNRISFTHLSSGKHRLSVRARLNDSRSSIKTCVITIASPWYDSFIAYCVYATLIILIIWVLFRSSKRKREQELSEIKLQSFTNVAHEICSPMTMIISPLEELLSDSNLDESTINSLKQMHKSSNKILNIINQLLDIRKYDEGQMNISFTNTELVSFLMGPFELFTQTAEMRNITYSFKHSTDEIFAWINCDCIDKVLMNLLSNAFKYTHDNGTVEVSMDVGVDEFVNGPLHNYVEISVKDNGIGLDVNEAKRVFDRFYRAQSELTSVTLGMGIGLNYCKILVELHHGTIKAENRSDGHGSIFSFRLPLGNSHLKKDEMEENISSERMNLESDQINTEKTDASLKTHGTKKKILVIDDNDTMLDYIRENLQSMYKVISSRNGAEGLKMTISQMPDIVITDVVMPEMDGITLVKKLKSNSVVSHIPVILLSGKNKLQDRMEGINNGADYYLPKPFYMNELKSIIANLINNRLIIKGKFSGSQEQKDKIQEVTFESSDELLMKRIMNILNANINNSDFTIEKLSESVGLSRAQLHRKVKELTGFSAGKFVQNLKMQQAANLLKEKRVNVSQIANAVGYVNHSHFSTAFKEYYGVTPLEYIKQLDKEKPNEPINTKS